MKKQLISLSLLFIFALIVSGCAAKETVKEKELTTSEILTNFGEKINNKNFAFEVPAGTKVRNIQIDSINNNVEINLSSEFSNLPFRENNVKEIYEGIKAAFGPKFSEYNFEIKTMKYPIEDLIPNFFRKDKSNYDKSRIPSTLPERGKPVIENISKGVRPDSGLYNRNIVLWHSHGWYYNNNLDRWEWQRPRLFQSVEDLIPMSFTLPYLIPMLENAGANVFVPRERDTQRNEVVVDNDMKDNSYSEEDTDKNNIWETGIGEAFAYGNPPYGKEFNPFKAGTHRITKSAANKTASASFIPEIPEEGYYSVYIAYSASDQNVNDAHYTVYHSGGKTEFRINQTIGGSTWEYLGKFKFIKGRIPNLAK